VVASVLETRGLSKAFGGVVAVADVTVAVGAGELLGIVGANGAGKTTFLNLITGYVRPDQGRVFYQGRDITGRRPREMARLGLARSFQVPQVYRGLTVMENVLLALAAQRGASYGCWRPLRTAEREDAALALLDAFGLRAEASRLTSELPEGGLKLLDVALALALRPRVLLLDEPTSGVSTRDKFAVMETLTRVLRQEQVTVLFVEHDMDVVTRYAERVLAFVEGRIVADGAPQAVLADPAVRKAVLGLA
jgi:branched-chain amino acid transport system ATP-binding protein